jgi:hypothetical protein
LAHHSLCLTKKHFAVKETDINLKLEKDDPGLKMLDFIAYLA